MKRRKVWGKKSSEGKLWRRLLEDKASPFLSLVLDRPLLLLPPHPRHPFSEILEERSQAYLLSFVLPPFSFYLAGKDSTGIAPSWFRNNHGKTWRRFNFPGNTTVLNGQRTMLGVSSWGEECGIGTNVLSRNILKYDN